MKILGLGVKKVTIKIQKNPIGFINLFGKSTSTFVFRQEVSVNKGMRIEDAQGKLENLKIEVGDDLLTLKGKYRNTKGMFRSLEPYEVYVQIPVIGAKPHMKAVVSTEVNIDPPISELRDGEEKAHQYTTINFEVTVYEETEVPVICDIKCNDASYQKELIIMETPLITGNSYFEKEIKLPEEFEGKELIDHENEIYISGYEVKEEEIEIKGKSITRIYVENEDEVEEYISEEEFIYPIPLGGLPKNARLILDGDVKLQIDSKTRSGGLRQTFNFTADAYSSNSFYGITHFDGGKKWDVMKKKVKVETVLAEGSSQTILNRDIQIKRDIKHIIRSKAEGRVTDVRVIHNKVIVSGVVDKQIFFTEEGSNIVMEETVQDTFTHFVHLDGVHPGAHVRSRVRVEYVNHRIIGKREVHGKVITDIRQSVVIEIRVFARKFKEIDLVTDAIPVSPIVYPPCHHPHHPHHKPPKARIINYTVRSGDSLWKIARRYNTTIEAILSLNYIPNPDRIDIGQIIRVPIGY